MNELSKLPLVTVLLPCYNAMPYLYEALDSIINQTYTHLEILCINDGSTDDTGKILEEYAQKDSRIKVIHNKTNLRLIRTLNKGIELAQGEYIARMDADDISVLNRIEIQYNYMKAHPEIDILSTGSYNMTEEGKVFSKKTPRAHSSVACFYASFFYVPIGHPELLIRTEVLKKNHFLFEDHVLHTEDYELWARLLRQGYNLSNMDEPLLYFRFNSQSVSRKFTQIQDENFVVCAQLHYDAYTNIKHPVPVIKVMANRIDTNTQLEDFKKGIQEMKQFKKYFINREKIADKTILNEIQVVYLTHMFDVCYQAIKVTNRRIKIIAFWFLLSHVTMFFNKKVRLYLKNKIRYFS